MQDINRNIDGGWAWVVLTCSVSCLFLVGFLGYSMGVINVALLDKYQGDISFTSAVVSMLIGVMSSTGPLAGLTIKRFGCRTCTILGGILATVGLTGASLAPSLTVVMWTFGVITGFGYGLSYTSAIVIVGFYFEKLRPLATGITVAGAGLGMFAGPPIIQYLINVFGISGTFLIVAALSSHNCVFGSLMRPLGTRQEEKVIVSQKELRSESRNIIISTWNSFKESMLIFRKWSFTMYLFSTVCWNIAESACFAHLPAYCILKGSTKEEAAFLYSIMGITNLSSRLLTGFAANDERISKLVLLAGQMSLAAVVTLLFPLTVTSYAGQMTYAGLIGLYSSGANTLMSPLAVYLIGLKDLPVGFGFVSLLGGIGYLAGPPLAGIIVDSGATYRESFIFAGSMYVLAGVSALLVPLVIKSGENQSDFVEGKRGSVEMSIKEPTMCDEETKMIRTFDDRGTKIMDNT